MKYIIHIFGTFTRVAIISFIISLLFGGLHYLGYLLSWTGKPTWANILGMTVFLWTILIVKGICSVLLFIYHCNKDPNFKRAAFQTGISWSDYKRLKKAQQK